jgi:hypothetical protein
MGDKRGLLRLCGPYTLAPSATGSDHRPVCLTASLYRMPTPLAPPPGAPKLLSVYTLELCNFRFDADEWGALDVTGLSLTHPLPTEDPLAFHRKADHLLDSVRQSSRQGPCLDRVRCLVLMVRCVVSCVCCRACSAARAR